MIRQRDLPCTLLAILLLAFVGLAAWYSLVIPLGEAPDEAPHYTVIRYVVQHGALPSTEEEHEAFQPPLYYVAGAALTFWIPDEAPFAILANADYDLTDPLAPRNLLLHPAAEAWPFRGWVLAWHLVRLLSVALGAVTVWAVYHLGRELFPERPEIGLAMAALTGFTPQFLFMSAIANNDNAATALSAVVLWQTVALLRRKPLRLARSLGVGLLLGIGLLSKASLIGLVPVVGLGILIAWWRHRAGGVRRLLLAWLVAFGAAGLVSGWYFVRNQVLFGDPLGWSFLLNTNALREGPLTTDVLNWLVRGVFRSFWLGWIGIEFDAWIYWAIAALCLAGAIGFCTWIGLRWQRMDGSARWAILLLAVHAAITWFSLVRWTATVLGTDQGRLIYPMLPTVMLVLVGGLLVWWPAGIRRWGAGVLAVAWLALALVTPGRYIAPVHAPPTTLDALPDVAHPVDVRFGRSIRLVGYHLDASQVQPGERLPVQLYWQADEAPDADVWAYLELVDAEGDFIMYKDGSPSAGRDTTDRWTPGQIVAATHRLAIPSHSPPGTYWLRLRMHPSGVRDLLPVTTPEGAIPDGVFVFDGPVQVMARPLPGD